MATKLTKMGHFNKQPYAVALEPISIEVEFDRLTTAQRNRRRFWGRL